MDDRFEQAHSIRLDRPITEPRREFIEQHALAASRTVYRARRMNCHGVL